MKSNYFVGFWSYLQKTIHSTNQTTKQGDRSMIGGGGIILLVVYLSWFVVVSSCRLIVLLYRGVVSREYDSIFSRTPFGYTACVARWVMNCLKISQSVRGLECTNRVFVPSESIEGMKKWERREETNERNGWMNQTKGGNEPEWINGTSRMNERMKCEPRRIIICGVLYPIFDFNFNIMITMIISYNNHSKSLY